jgi:hypothetical protein
MLEREQFMLAMHALLLRTEMLTQRGAVTEAAAAGRDLMLRCARDGAPPSIYVPDLWWTVHQALAPVDPAAAGDALQRALVWIERETLPRVPEVFRQSFLERNTTNAQVRAAARQLAPAR